MAASPSKKEWVVELDSTEVMPPIEELVPEPSHVYPFPLDTFQKQAIMCLERHDNVFVAAHTSAGKTVVADYAIAMSLNREKRVIYTSPIKALSNQKYRDFKTEFGLQNVGILTGDVQIRPDAPCLVMTTEILLQMLYNQSEVIKELEWVIFDEVHYCNDPERGHVWEKIFILLPDHIALVLLSATVANIPVYADWLGRIRKKKTYVMSTSKRPVPLEHYLFVGKNSRGVDEKFLFIEKEGKLLDTGYKKALTTFNDKQSLFDQKFSNKMSAAGERNLYIGLIRHLECEDRLPVIIFTLSRKRCDSHAIMLSQSMDLNTNREKGLIHTFVARSLFNLASHDRDIPQVKDMMPMLKAGFGVHHSGVLPILKEITEILFTFGLVKVLFATETFAMGVNMPARSVVFDSVDKHDGTRRRNLMASEYIQMAGRAGRRGKDTTGTVVIVCRDEVPELSDLQRMALGKAPPLMSQFRLTYSMILNLVRSRGSGVDMEGIMGRSFTEHPKRMHFDKMKDKKKILLQELKEFTRPDCDLCRDDAELCCQDYANYVNTLGPLENIITLATSKNGSATYGSVNALVGRLVIFEDESCPFSLGLILHYARGPSSSTILTILHINLYDNKASDIFKIDNYSLHWILAPVPFLKMNPQEVAKEMGKPHKPLMDQVLSHIMGYLYERGHELGPIQSPSSLFLLPHYDFTKELKMNSLEQISQKDRMVHSRNRVLSHACIECPKFGEHFTIGHAINTKRQMVAQLEEDLSPNSMAHMPEYKKMFQVLKELGFIEQHDDVLTKKGVVGCTFKDHELVLTTLMFTNFFNGMTVPQFAAILSGFVYQAKSHSLTPPDEALANMKKEVLKIATEIGEVQVKCGIQQPVGDFVELINYNVMYATYEWASGSPLSTVMQTTDAQEGLMVRSFQRLAEILEDLKTAYITLSSATTSEWANDPLLQLIQETSVAVRRDIVFMDSLYLADENVPDTILTPDDDLSD